MSIYQHFRPEEKPFIEKMMEWAELVQLRGISKRTDFLDPRQANILESIANRMPGIQVFFNGGYPDAERVRAVIVPDYVIPTDEEFGISLIDIENRNPFSTPTHRDYLGALLNIGLIRDKFGDLLVHDSGAQLIIETEVRDYLLTQMKQVGRSTVLLSELPFDKIHIPEALWEEKMISVASNRLDAVLSEMLNTSRAKVQTLIKASKVKVNWKIEDSSSMEIQVGDTISVRGFGRFKILREKGTSKKGKLVFIFGFFNENK